MNKFRKNLLNLSLVASSLCLSFNAFASNLSDLPDEVTKNYILKNFDMHIASNYSNLTRVSKKFYDLIQKMDIEILGNSCPGITKRSELENIIKNLFTRNYISVCPSTNPEFNKSFSFAEETIYQKSISCNFHTNFFASYEEDLLYPTSEKAIVEYMKDGRAYVSSPSAHLIERNIAHRHKFFTRGEISIFTDPTENSDNVLTTCINKDNGGWPFQSIKQVVYKEYFPLSLENDNEKLIKLVDRHPTTLSKEGLLYASSILPDLYHFVDYIVSGLSIEGKDIIVIYRFAQKKKHSRQLINGLNDGSLPRR